MWLILLVKHCVYVLQQHFAISVTVLEANHKAND